MSLRDSKREAMKLRIQAHKIEAEAIRKSERERIIKLLKDLKVIRNSMLGDNWKVIYTEKGAMDITLDRLEGTE